MRTPPRMSNRYTQPYKELYTEVGASTRPDNGKSSGRANHAPPSNPWGAARTMRRRTHGVTPPPKPPTRRRANPPRAATGVARAALRSKEPNGSRGPVGGWPARSATRRGEDTRTRVAAAGPLCAWPVQHTAAGEPTPNRSPKDHHAHKGPPRQNPNSTQSPPGVPHPRTREA